MCYNQNEGQGKRRGDISTLVTRNTEPLFFFFSDLSLHVLHCNRLKCCVRAGRGKGGPRHTDGTFQAFPPLCHCLPAPASGPQSLWVRTELMGPGEQGEEDVFIKRHQTVHGELCYISINYWEEKKKVTHSSTKHKKFLGVSREGKRLDLKVFID